MNSIQKIISLTLFFLLFLFSPILVLADAVTPQKSSQTTLRELPKTGLPAAAIFLSGLVPVGVVFKKFSRQQQKTEAVPFYSWQQREFDRA